MKIKFNKILTSQNANMLIAGVGCINSDLFEGHKPRTLILQSFDSKEMMMVFGYILEEDTYLKYHLKNGEIDTVSLYCLFDFNYLTGKKIL